MKKLPKGRPGADTPRGDDEAQSGDDAEAAAFAKAMRGVKPLGERSRRLAARVAQVPASTAAGRFRRRSSLKGPAARLAGPKNDGEASPADGAVTVEQFGEDWSGRANGVDHRALRRLRAGHLPIQASVDLHGLTRHQASAALDRFFTTSQANGSRVVLVIHGRGLHSGAGAPTLRDTLREAMFSGHYAPSVLAFCSAPAAAGGPGATLILLRARRSPRL